MVFLGEHTTRTHLGPLPVVPTTILPISTALKHDSDKARWDLQPWDALAEVTDVWTYGAKKYADRNWEKGFHFGRSFAACMRHLSSWFCGEDNDPETGKSHIAHAICNLLMLLTFVKRGTGIDDRAKASPAKG